MKHAMLTVAMMTAIIITGSSVAAIGADTDSRETEIAAIHKAVEAYVAAFNQGDAKTLASMWSPDAVYTNPLSGEQVVGREAIEQQFISIFEQAKGTKLEVATESIKFVSPNVAIEQGSAKVMQADQPPEESEYSAVFIKRDGNWLLDRVTEEDWPVVVSHYEQLKQLEWMIGTWVDEDDVNRIETTCEWTKNQNFITRSFTVSVRNRIQMSGMQFVGWDPAKKQIRSWVFDSDGGFSEGLWTKKDKSWHIQSVGTLPDGGKSSSINIITMVDDNSFTWQSIDREAGGELLPNVDEVVVVRQDDQSAAQNQ